MPDIRRRRWLYLLLVAVSTVFAVLQLWHVLRIDRLTGLEAGILVLFAILFAWIAASFWLACFGAFAKLFKIRVLPLAEAAPAALAPSRTAILMPVYNEDVGRVFSGLRAVFESLRGVPGFDFYILSDSTDAAHWIAEEIEWQVLRRLPGGDAVYYRHRARNTGRKSGNIQDFCENWGALYDYMVILDADSLMTGETLHRLVGLMDANPRAALIQAPAQLVGRNSLFARMQQFSSSVYGPLVTAGLAWLQQADGNYWGHNAILRVRAFMDHCGLPRLAGSPPFGGHIMSHDFVEAAFLRRAGWQVWMAPEIGGSFEEPPPTLLDHLKRDRRWCQGNLQHLRIVFARGLTLPSRLHLAMGIMSYLSSPLWLLLLAASAGAMMMEPATVQATFIGIHPVLGLATSHAATLVWLVLATLALLFVPKFLAVALLARAAKTRRAHGGWLGIWLGAGAECVFSTLFAPIIMLTHSGFIAGILLGRSSGWASQHRQDRALPLGVAALNFWPHTLVGVVVAGFFWRMAPAIGIWFIPLLAGLVLSIPLVTLTSSLTLGLAARRVGLFLIPSETRGLAVLQRAHHLLAQRAAVPDDARRLVLDDPEVRAMHIALLTEAVGLVRAEPHRLVQLVEAARARALANFTREDWMLLLSDAESLRRVAQMP